MSCNPDSSSDSNGNLYPLTAGLGEVPIEAVLSGILGADRRVSIGVIDRQGTFMMLNAFAAKPYGVDDPSKLYGKNIGDYVTGIWVEELLGFVRRCIKEDTKITILLMSGGFRIRTQLVPIRTSPGDAQASCVLVMSEEIKAQIYEQIVSDPPDDEVVVHSELVSLGPLDVLSTRELEVLALMREGLRTKEIADRLHRSLSTILKHRESIGRKLKLHDRSEMIELANIAVLQVEDASRTRLGARIATDAMDADDADDAGGS